MTAPPRASGTVVLPPVPVAPTREVYHSAESRRVALALWSTPLVAGLAVVEDAVTVEATFETVTEIYETEIVNAIFATPVMHPRFVAIWTATGVAGSATLTLVILPGLALVEDARAHPRVTFEI